MHIVSPFVAIVSPFVAFFNYSFAPLFSFIPTDGNNSSIGLQQCAARDLVRLGHVLAELPGHPPSPLVDAFSSALWPKLDQLPPAAAMLLFQLLVGWGYQMPGPMLHSFLAQVRAQAVGTGRE